MAAQIATPQGPTPTRSRRPRDPGGQREARSCSSARRSSSRRPRSRRRSRSWPRARRSVPPAGFFARGRAACSSLHGLAFGLPRLARERLFWVGFFVAGAAASCSPAVAGVPRAAAVQGGLASDAEDGDRRGAAHPRDGHLRGPKDTIPLAHAPPRRSARPIEANRRELGLAIELLRRGRRADDWRKQIAEPSEAGAHRRCGRRVPHRGRHRRRRPALPPPPLISTGPQSGARHTATTPASSSARCSSSSGSYSAVPDLPRPQAAAVGLRGAVPRGRAVPAGQLPAALDAARDRDRLGLPRADPLPVALSALIVPPLVTQVTHLVNDLPSYAHDLQDFAQQEPAAARARARLPDLPAARGAGARAAEHGGRRRRASRTPASASSTRSSRW